MVINTLLLIQWQFFFHEGKGGNGERKQLPSSHPKTFMFWCIIALGIYLHIWGSRDKGVL